MSREVTNAIKDALQKAGINTKYVSVVHHWAGYSEVYKVTLKDKSIDIEKAKRICRAFNVYDTDERSGEILEGGNTWVGVEYDHKIEYLTEALKRAVLAAQELKDTEDGGTSNFDAPKLYLPGWKQKSVESACRDAGLSCFEHRLFLKGKKGWVIEGGTSGQGNRRTRMAKRMAESLTNDGYECYMYYEKD